MFLIPRQCILNAWRHSLFFYSSVLFNLLQGGYKNYRWVAIRTQRPAGNVLAVLCYWTACSLQSISTSSLCFMFSSAEEYPQKVFILLHISHPLVLSFFFFFNKPGIVTPSYFIMSAFLILQEKVGGNYLHRKVFS